jgi:hypothetical protein
MVAIVTKAPVNAQNNLETMKNVSELVDFCATADNATLEKIVDQIHTHQPFVVSLFLGYKDDVDIF